jgi:hypothetical protein
MPYAPPSPMNFSSLPTSGSFVATPFSEGAPTPDMFRSKGSPLPGGYPDAYPSSPPPALGMYGGAPGGNMGFGSGGTFGFGSGPSPFMGFDSEVPGKALATPNYGSGPQAGSFVAVAPSAPSSKEGGNGASVRFSDSKTDHVGKDTDPRAKARAGESAPVPSGKAHSRSQMERSSRVRDGPARVKKKGERRACC